METSIRTLLVANRGEIARRIQRTARQMGVRTVAIYADDDANEPFVREADIAVPLKGRQSRETYLDTAKVLEAARRTGADAIHPGYGFLSENAAFARAVTEAGLTWIGPSPEAIEAMGDKLASKRLIVEAGVPTLPSIEVTASDDLTAAGEKIGYPILVKASAGGGGKGMRIVTGPTELQEAVSGAQREAAASFGDDTVFLERYVSRARHIEIQVLGDRHGGLVHCFERECSIQRRHQKVIEEAPSPVLSPELRERMGAAAVAAAKAVDYCSAGTVEFLLDGENFYFLEMNTRLQVEHPVTEAITGLDLVREQIRVAQGERLGFTQGDLAITGWAIEARLYAEDPANDFLPCVGDLSAFIPPATPEARFDAGVESGSKVGVEFDPMLAKVIVHAPTRTEAALRLATVLERTRIHGVVCNRDFLAATLRHPSFLAGDLSTDFIERVAPARTRVLSQADIETAAVAAALVRQGLHRDQARVWRPAPSGWRNTYLPWQAVTFGWGEDEVAVSYQRRRNGDFGFRIGEAEREARILRTSPQELDFELDGLRHRVAIAHVGSDWVVSDGRGDITLREAPRFPDRQDAGQAGGLNAPMPGRVVKLNVTQGQAVDRNDVLLILEAMKMEHRIVAPAAGQVSEVRVAEGDQVATGELLVVIHPVETTEPAK